MKNFAKSSENRQENAFRTSKTPANFEIYQGKHARTRIVYFENFAIFVLVLKIISRPLSIVNPIHSVLQFLRKTRLLVKIPISLCIASRLPRNSRQLRLTSTQLISSRQTLVSRSPKLQIHYAYPSRENIHVSCTQVIVRLYTVYVKFETEPIITGRLIVAN